MHEGYKDYTCPLRLILTDELIWQDGLQTASAQAGAKTKYTKPTLIWFSEPLDEAAFGYWEADEVSLHGSEIDLSQDGRKGSGAEMPNVFKNNARGLCDAG